MFQLKSYSNHNFILNCSYGSLDSYDVIRLQAFLHHLCNTNSEGSFLLGRIGQPLKKDELSKLRNIVHSFIIGNHENIPNLPYIKTIMNDIAEKVEYEYRKSNSEDFTELRAEECFTADFKYEF